MAHLPGLSTNAEKRTPSEQGVFSCKRISLTIPFTEPHTIDMTQTWNVTYQIKGNDKPFTNRCTITEGYKTMNDIPKMIAIKRGVEESDIILIALLREGFLLAN